MGISHAGELTIIQRHPRDPIILTHYIFLPTQANAAYEPQLLSAVAETSSLAETIETTISLPPAPNPNQALAVQTKRTTPNLTFHQSKLNDLARWWAELAALDTRKFQPLAGVRYHPTARQEEE